jgi:hypothetical protein
MAVLVGGFGVQSRFGALAAVHGFVSVCSGLVNSSRDDTHGAMGFATAQARPGRIPAGISMISGGRRNRLEMDGRAIQT